MLERNIELSHNKLIIFLLNLTLKTTIYLKASGKIIFK